MIGRLKGILIHKQPPWLVIDVHGVGYELEAPMSTIYDLPEIGREVMLFTHYAQKEDSVSLYGRLVQTGDVTALTRIPGIGKKTAERMVVELRDRAADFVTGGVSGSLGIGTDAQSEATSALQQLGYKPAEAVRMARDAAGAGDDAAAIIRKALQSALR
jgi:holliday junction DNA helicase RuvA